MCFRPGDVAKPIICPECGNRVPIVAGFRPKECPKCHAELPTAEQEDAALRAQMPASPQAPTPTSPQAPAVSGAPNPPQPPTAS